MSDERSEMFRVQRANLWASIFLVVTGGFALLSGREGLPFWVAICALVVGVGGLLINALRGQRENPPDL